MGRQSLQARETCSRVFLGSSLLGGAAVPETDGPTRSWHGESPVQPLPVLQETKRRVGASLRHSLRQDPAPQVPLLGLPHGGRVTLCKCPPLSGLQAAPLCWKRPTRCFPPPFLGPDCSLHRCLLLFSRGGFESGSGLSLCLCLSRCLGFIFLLTADIDFSSLQKPPGRRLMSL